MKKLLALLLCLTLFLSLAPTALAADGVSKARLSEAGKRQISTAIREKLPAADRDKDAAADKNKDTVADKLKDKAASQVKTPAPAPEKTPAPAPEKTPVPAPEKTPAPAPEKTPAPAPEKTPAPAPEKTPAPTQSKGPVITRQPEDLAVVSDKIATISIKATGKNLRYQWQIEVYGDWVNSTSSSADKDTLSFTAAPKLDGSRYRCVVSDDEGSVASEAVTLSIIYMPVITKQPHNVEAKEDEIVQIGLEATGTDLHYQWETIVNGIWRNSKDEGANTPAITLEGVAANKGRTFRCIISNAGGSLTSNVVVFSVKLRDEEALEQLQILSFNKDYEGVIRSAEEYYKDIPMKERDPKLLEACVHAYVQQAGKLQYAKQNEAAEKLLESCIDTYRATAAVKEAETALNNLNNSLKLNEPGSGTLLAESARGSFSELSVQAGNTPVLVKAENIDNPARFVLMYVRAGENGSVRLQDGRYTLRYAAGPRWYGREELFGSTTVYYEWGKTIELKTEDTKHPDSAAISLSSTKLGKTSAAGIDADDF